MEMTITRNTRWGIGLALALLLMFLHGTQVSAFQSVGQPLLPDDEFVGQFGVSVAIDGNVAVVGAKEDNELGEDAGAAYVFVRQNGSWHKFQKLLANDGNEGDSFGVSVAIEGSTIVVGAHGREVGNNAIAGAAYVFEWNGTQWQQTQQLSFPNNRTRHFGRSIAIDSSLNYTAVVIGAHGTLSPTALSPNAGAAFVFEKQLNGQWSLVKELYSDDEIGNEYFGGSVDIDNNGFVAVGEWNDNGGDGSAYVFRRDNGGNWSFLQKFTGVYTDAQAGKAVAIDNGFLAISYPYYNDGAGMVQTYKFAPASGNDTAPWKYDGTLIAEPGYAGQQFGYNLSTDRQNLIVAHYTGAPHLYTRLLNGQTWSFMGAWDTFDGTMVVPALSGQRAVLGRYGYGQASAFNIDLPPIYQSSPQGTITLAYQLEKLMWTENAISDWFRVRLLRDGQVLLDNWYPDSSKNGHTGVCTNGGCEIPAPLMTNGEYQWEVTYWSAIYGLSNPQTTNFTVAIPPVGVIEGTGPNGELTQPVTAIRWTHKQEALWYRVYLVGQSGKIRDQWYRAADICPTTTCFVDFNALTNGDYQWWIQGWGAAGFGEWNAEPHTFTVAVAEAPGYVTRVAPAHNDTVSSVDSTITLVWQRDTLATWYQVHIRDEANQPVMDEWVYVPDVCGSTNCELSIPLPGPGKYRWWQRGWGPAGMGDWSQTSFTLVSES